MQLPRGSFEAMDEIAGPKAGSGHHDKANQKLVILTKEKIEAEEERRKNSPVFSYCIVFPAEPPKTGFVGAAINNLKNKITEVKVKTQAEVDDERHEILSAIRNAGFVTESVLSSTRKQIITKIGTTDSRLLREAENKMYKLQVDPKSLQWVLELKVKELDPEAKVSKPVSPVFLGYDEYDEEKFELIQHLGGPKTLPLFMRTNFDQTDPEGGKIDINVARKTMREQSRMNPFRHIHFKYDEDWERKIINEHRVQLYRSYNDGTILRTADRITLTLSALGSETFNLNGVRGAGLDLKKLEFQKKILAYYPIEYSSQTKAAGDLTSEDLYRKFKTRVLSFLPKMYLPWKQPIDDIRDYAGEKIAYYFAFLEFYSFWLLFTAVPGLVIFLAQIGYLKMEADTYNIVTSAVKIIFNTTDEAFPGRPADNITDDEIKQFVFDQDFTTSRTQFARSVDGEAFIYNIVPTELPLIIPIYSLFIALWAAFFLEFWKRRQNSLAFRWGVSDYEQHAEVRPEFVHEYDVPDVVTGLPTPYRSPLWFGVQLAFSFSMVGTAVAVTVAAFAATYIFKAFMSQSETLDPTIATQVALVLNAVAIMILSTVFRIAGVILTNWENHRTDIEYEDMLIGKTFIFSFFNSYTTLIYFAFFRKGSDLPPHAQTQYCVAELQAFDQDNIENEGNVLFADEGLTRIDTCYGALGYSLMIVFVTQILISNGIELGTPLITKFVNDYFSIRNIRDKAKNLGHEGIANVKGIAETAKVAMTGYHDGGEEKAPEPEMYDKKMSRPLKSPGEIQFLLTPYETPFYDYLELGLQFGYVTLFVAAFPLAPTLALLNNVVEVWVDAQKVCMLSRRPNLPRAQDIGTWMTIFTILSYLAIVINSGVLLFSSEEIIPISAEHPETKVWYFLAFIVFVFLIKYCTDFFISDVPTKIKVQKERQDYFERKIFYDDEDGMERVYVQLEKKHTLDEDKEEAYKEFKILQHDPYLDSIVVDFREKLKEKGLDEGAIFDMIDVNHNNVITLKEVKKALLRKDIGLGAKMKRYEIRMVVDSLDIDGDGLVTKDELRSFLNDYEAEPVPEAQHTV